LIDRGGGTTTDGTQIRGNNLIVQITMITVQNQAQAQSLQGLLR